jgi:hypothetical protein
MLQASDSERQRIVDYMAAAVAEERVAFLQKLYSEIVQGVRHDVWDVHTSQSRWWVITHPTNLYSQEEFPNLDLALTFHVGLCVRIPNSERPDLSTFPAEPLLTVARELGEIQEALLHAQEVPDFQAIGVRCCESLLSLVHSIQDSTDPSNPHELKRSDFRGWTAFIADSLLCGPSHQGRRALLKSTAASAWDFTNWLAHARSSHFQDAEAALAATELTISLFTVVFIRNLRGVPQACPSCGSQRLALQWAQHADATGIIHEWPLCEVCNWTGTAVPFEPKPGEPANRSRGRPAGDCSIATVPLRGRRPHEPSRPD